jgi:hypothetical protein
MVIYRSLPNNKNVASLKFRLSVAQDLMEKHSSGVPCSVHGHPAIESPPERLAEKHFLEHIHATGKKAKPERKYAHETWEKEGFCISM